MRVKAAAKGLGHCCKGHQRASLQQLSYKTCRNLEPCSFRTALPAVLLAGTAGQGHATQPCSLLGLAQTAQQLCSGRDPQRALQGPFIGGSPGAAGAKPAARALRPCVPAF